MHAYGCVSVCVYWYLLSGFIVEMKKKNSLQHLYPYTKLLGVSKANLFFLLKIFCFVFSVEFLAYTLRCFLYSHT